MLIKSVLEIEEKLKLVLDRVTANNAKQHPVASENSYLLGYINGLMWVLSGEDRKEIK